MCLNNIIDAISNGYLELFKLRGTCNIASPWSSIHLRKCGLLIALITSASSSSISAGIYMCMSVLSITPAYPCAKFCHSHPTLTMTHRRRRTHQSAQFFTNDSNGHRESVTSRLSVESSFLLKQLCISIAVRVTYLCTWEGAIRVIAHAGIAKQDPCLTPHQVCPKSLSRVLEPLQAIVSLFHCSLSLPPPVTSMSCEMRLP